MLKVGRQPDIQNQTIVCRECAWEGFGNGLSTGLVRVRELVAYLCVYCCPACGSPAVTPKGKVLAFRPRPAVEQESLAMASSDESLPNEWAKRVGQTSGPNK